MKTRSVEYLVKREASGLLRCLRSVTPLSARECLVEGVSGACIDFSSNDYLGLSGRRDLVEESVIWTTRYGVGSRASRLVTGTLPEYIRLEEQIAEWKGYESALLLGSGFLANTGLIPALARRKSAVFADKLNHASLNAGCLLSGAVFRRYAHNDITALSGLLAGCSHEDRLVVSDTVFSMDGDVPDLEGLYSVATAGGAKVYLDDAHATGVFGDGGRGLACAAVADVAMGTFSKALGCYGAYVACTHEMRDYFVNACGSFIYSTALPPGVCGAISAAVALVQTEELAVARKTLMAKSAKFAKDLRSLGFDTGNTVTPIVPVILGDAVLAMRISQILLEKGFLVVAIRPPTVPEGGSRLRISLNAVHTEEDVSRLLDSLVEAYRECGGVAHA
ncbi:MAG: 8-amino-7-oxononanoate synthase [Victivallales bacterium]|nr:8-amino-7-oxononanoate synthase [Victivallales bacterium]